MSMRPCLLRSVIALMLAAGVSRQSTADDALQLPGLWLNSPPVTVEQLRGKLVVLYFFEEDCPRCREAWPEKLDLAKKYADKPVIFVGVNSGTAPQKLQSYLRDVKIPWPTIVDFDRSFEKLAGVGEISLQNISQLAVITPEGRLAAGAWNDWEGTITRNLGDAQWRVDPSEIPPGLKPVWQSLELGDFSGALAGLAKSKKFKDKESVAAIEKLNAAIGREFDERLAAAKTADEAGEKWQAFQQYRSLAAAFKAWPEVKAAKEGEKLLAKDEAVARELKAAAQLKKATGGRAETGGALDKRKAAALSAIVKDFPGTQAAEQAQKLLEP